MQLFLPTGAIPSLAELVKYKGICRLSVYRSGQFLLSVSLIIPHLTFVVLHPLTQVKFSAMRRICGMVK